MSTACGDVGVIRQHSTQVKNLFDEERIEVNAHHTKDISVREGEMTFSSSSELSQELCTECCMCNFRIGNKSSSIEWAGRNKKAGHRSMT